MNATTLSEPKRIQTEPTLRLWFPMVCILAFWVLFLVAGSIEKPYFYSFLFQLGSSALFTLLFFGWWWFNRGLSLKQKFGGFVIFVGGAVAAAMFLDKSVSPFILWRLGLPIFATVAILWFKRAHRLRRPYVGAMFLFLALATWSGFLLVRTEGADSTLKLAYHWRWTPSTEEKFLASAPSPKVPKALPESSEAAPAKNQWTGFRGENRDGVVLGSSISTNWSAPPATLWKRAVGPSWSAMTVIGRRLFTQEQRGAAEAVVCYDADTGDELWAHEDAARFEESLAGIGPRTTPTFREGKIYTLGATGILNCLQATDGKEIWTKNIQADSGAPVPMWGFSSSPLVVDRKVIVYAGGAKGLLAYGAEKGDLLWNTPAGETSYSSAQMNLIDGMAQCLMLHDGGVLGLDPATGKKLWETGYNFKGGPRSTQPHAFGTNEFLVGALDGPGLSSIKVVRAGENWQVATNWISKDLKPEFPDFVVFKDHVYGFDVSLFCCVKIADGKRAWKEGRYGRGQVILLADQGLLLVASETGDLVLLAADPSGHRELGRFKALEGKTWNGPVVNGDRIYHRNAQEMACFTFSPVAKLAAR